MKLYVISKADGKKIYLKPKYVSVEKILTRKILREVIGSNKFNLDNTLDVYKIEEVIAERDIESNFLPVMVLSLIFGIAFGFESNISTGIGAFIMFFVLFFFAAEFSQVKENNAIHIFNHS